MGKKIGGQATVLLPWMKLSTRGAYVGEGELCPWFCDSLRHGPPDMRRH